MSTESDLLVFGHTSQRDDKLTLFVGREPNNDLPREHGVGSHPFGWKDSNGKSKTCPFWNNAYGLSARTIDHGPGWLKAGCIRADASPIAFTDLSPKSLNGSVSSHMKRRLRAEIPSTDIERHIERVFSHDIIRERVALVVATGIIGCGLDHGMPALERICARLDLPLADIHSLSSTHHSHAQRLEQLAGRQQVIRRTLGAFMLANAPDLMSESEVAEHSAPGSLKRAA